MKVYIPIEHGEGSPTFFCTRCGRPATLIEKNAENFSLSGIKVCTNCAQIVINKQNEEAKNVGDASSSNGRTPVFDTENVGSIPAEAAKEPDFSGTVFEVKENDGNKPSSTKKGITPFPES